MAKRTWSGNTSGAWGTASNWVEAAVPIAADDVLIPAGAALITGSDQSATALGYVLVEEGYATAIGAAPTAGAAAVFLKLNCTRFEFGGSGVSYIDLGASAIRPRVFGTAAAATGKHGLYLKGSALATLSVDKGNVGLAALHGETATVTTARTAGSSATLKLGAGVTVTTVQVLDGTIEQRCASTTSTAMAGELRTKEVGAITTLNGFGGLVYPESTGTITTLNIEGANVDFTRSGAARTVTTTNWKRGELAAGPAVTFTNNPIPPTDRNWRASLAV